MSVYIKSIAQVSTQTPLDDGFFRQPQVCAGPYVRCVEADYKAFISPVAARRMGPVLKRAIATSAAALKQAGVEDPDAIVCGTGLGCIENTEKFLSAIDKNGEITSTPMPGNEVWMKINYDFNTDKATMAYSFDGSEWTSVDYQLQMRFTLDYFTGYRSALYNYATKELGGAADFDYFHQDLI